MKLEILDFFPLTILKDKIELDKTNKQEIINYLLENKKRIDIASGEEFTTLFKENLFNNLAKIIGQKIKFYTSNLSIDNEKFHFFFQRVWVSISKEEKNFIPSSFEQSNISFHYCIQNSTNSSIIRFIRQNDNEIAKGIFNQENLKTTILKNKSARNISYVDLTLDENSLIVFSSKTSHLINFQNSKNPIISISGTATIMLKDSYGHAKLMPHFSNWDNFLHYENKKN